MSNLSIIDSSTLSWKQISEIRSDTESKRRLARLRLFVFENFHDKPTSYVEDKLGVAIEDYKLASKKHGASLKKAAITLTTSDRLATAALSSVAAAAAGMDIPLQAAVGASALLAGTLVEIRSTRKLAEEELARSPVRFLIDIQDKSK